MVTQLATPLSCLYVPDTKHGIHHFVFKSPSHQAIDQWFEVLETLYASAPNSQCNRFVIDMRQSGMLPMTYTLRKGRRWLSEHPLKTSTRFALLHRADFPLSLAQTFLRLVNTSDGHVIRFFPMGHEQEALDWLMTETC